MRHIFFRILAGLVLIAAIAGIALLAYNAGVTHGQAISTTAVQSGSQPYVVPYWWPFPFFGFGFFGLLAVLFLLSIAFGAMRFALWGPRWGWRRMHRGWGYWGERGSGEDIPPMFTELHRRMHAAEGEKPSDQATH